VEFEEDEYFALDQWYQFDELFVDVCCLIIWYTTWYFVLNFAFPPELLLPRVVNITNMSAGPGAIRIHRFSNTSKVIEWISIIKSTMDIITHAQGASPSKPPPQESVSTYICLSLLAIYILRSYYPISSGDNKNNMERRFEM
jgi:hypothetical protein